MKDTRPAATCTACGFAWRSAAMAEGLRLLGSCPRCGGELEFGGDTAPPADEPAVADVDPSRVLGVPRRPGA